MGVCVSVCLCFKAPMMREPTLIIAMLPSLALVIDVDHCVSGLLVLSAELDQYYPVYLKTDFQSC